MLSGEVRPLPSHVFSRDDGPAALCFLTSGASAALPTTQHHTHAWKDLASGEWKRCLPNALYAGPQNGKVLVHVACDVPISAVPQVYFRYGPDSLQLWRTSCSSFLNLNW